MSERYGIDFGTGIRSLTRDGIQPVYILQGDDYFLQNFFLGKVAEHFFGDLPVDRSLLLPDELSGKEIIERLTSVDLFSSRKLFVIRNAQQIAEPYRSALREYCRNPFSSQCLVMINDDVFGRYAIYKDLEKQCVKINVSRPFESEMKKWIMFFFKEQNVNASGPVREALLQIAGDSIYHIANEVEKLCLWKGEDSRIAVEDVFALSGWQRGYQPWEFLNAVGSRDLARSIRLGKALLNQGYSILQLVSQLTTLFQELLFRMLPEGTSGAGRGFTALYPSVRRNIPGYSRNFTRETIETALTGLGQVDQRIKSSTTIPESELAFFLFRVLGGDEQPG